MSSTLQFTSRTADLAATDHLVVVGRSAQLLSAEIRRLLPAQLAPAAWEDMVKRGDPGDTGRSASSFTGVPQPYRVTAIVLPEVCSRHNAPSRGWAISPHLAPLVAKGTTGVLMALEAAEHAVPAAIAIARACPSFSAASHRGDREVRVSLVAPNGVVPHERAAVAAAAVRKAAEWTDRPPELLNTTAFTTLALAIGRGLPGVSVYSRVGDQLREAGLTGLFAVGRAAVEPPAFVVLDWSPPNATRKLAWVGKGLVYDTGGLALKDKAGMPGMKADMAGAAAVLAAFEAAVALGCPHRLTAALCIAENAIGPTAIRPDDVIAMYSGRSVEVNNPDAEGRIVLSDGAAWVAKHRSPDELLTLATLTGAQSMSTGKKIAAIYATDDELEHRVVAAGRASGDLCHPLPYVPEFWRREFASPIADMKNSVKDRNNAQSACAAQFIGNHLGGHTRPWVHVDMAGPAVDANARGTGYGVGLLLALAEAL